MADDQPITDKERQFHASAVMGVWGLLALFGAYLALTSIAVMDEPGAAKDPKIVIFVISCWALPVFAGLAAVGGYHGVMRAKPLIALLTAIPAVVTLLVFASAFGAWWT
jgi:small-conductance mechanosensitive channel